MTNYELYDLGIKYKSEFKDYDQYIPPRINYYLNLNFSKLKEAVQNLDDQKLYIWQHYGYEKDGVMHLPESQIQNANYDFEQLMILESIVNFNLIPLSWFPDDLTFTMPQMEVLIKMIDENK